MKGGVHAINAADDNILDEEAERLAFMQAVEEWRKGDSAVTKTVTIVREFERKHPPDVSNLQINVSGSDTVSDGMWRNPFASDSTVSSVFVLFCRFELCFRLTSRICQVHCGMVI